jgi:hypothetical protein
LAAVGGDSGMRAGGVAAAAGDAGARCIRRERAFALLHHCAKKRKRAAVHKRLCHWRACTDAGNA